MAIFSFNLEEIAGGYKVKNPSVVPEGLTHKQM